MNLKYDKDLENFIELNENSLLELWDTYKYENLQENFHYDNVDYFDEGLFSDMCINIHDSMTEEVMQ